MSNVGFVLKKIVTDQFATIEKEIKAKAEDEIQLQVNISYGVDIENKILACTINIQYKSESTPIIVLKLTCNFQIDEKSWKSFLKTKSKKIIFPAGFVQHMAVITIGTARGVIHAKTENTPYNKFYLPTLNVKETLTNDVVFNLLTKN